MTKPMSLLASLALVLGATACKKKHYSSNCSRSVSLAAPWDAMKLPSGDNVRVCSSNDLKTDLEYLDADRAHWETAYETVMTGLGYAKERCNSTACSYTKAGGEKISVQINQVAAGKKAKTIVHLTRTPGKAPPPEAPAAPTAGSPTTNK